MNKVTEETNQPLQYKGKAEKWDYIGEADITLGEIKQSKTSKYILLGLVFLLCILGVLAIVFKDKLQDRFNPENILLTNSEIQLEVNRDIFDYKDYIYSVPDNDRFIITYPDNSSVDTTKLGQYEVIYTLQDSINIKEYKLLVNVVDTTPPDIVLTKIADSALITDEERKAEDYIYEVIDNYDTELDISIPKIDWKIGEQDLEFSAIDKSGNIGKATVHLLIVEHELPTEPHTHEWDEGKIIKEATYTEEGLKVYTCLICGETYPETIPIIEHTHKWTEEIIKNPTYTETGKKKLTCSLCGETKEEVIDKLVEPTTVHTHNWTRTVTREATYSQTGIITYTCSCGESYTETIPMLTTPYVPPTTQYIPPTTPYVPPTTPYIPPTTPYVPPTTKAPSGAYINGVHDITVKVGTSPQEVLMKLVEGVYGSGYVSVDVSSVNTTVAGVYTATISSSDGVKKTAKVTIIP